ncbi:hypothetical protein ACF0H5_006962 [Mactra antiquata]
MRHRDRTLSVYLVSTDHHCRRDCNDRVPRLCEYHFTIENYFVLSRACYGCPFNYTDCFRPHCVSTNGLMRHILTVNRQMPGPSIEVCKGDTVRVMVENKMDEAASTAIHWHGLKQINSNPQDGVPRLTQCYIQPFETFKYEFTADNAGTHWWHSHTAVQFGDGLLGAFIVRESDQFEPSRNLYDVDEPDHVMIISDWADRPQMFRYMEEMQHRWVTPKMVKDVTQRSFVALIVLVNGRGRKYLVEDPVGALGHGVGTTGYTPYEMFHVYEGMRYRFRVIAAATRCYFRVMVDSHRLTVIASDGVPMTPTVVDYFMIHPGERYDFVLDASQKPDSYWIKVQAYGDCQSGGNDGNGGAILHYHGYVHNDNNEPLGDIENYTTDGILLNPETSQLEPNSINQISQGKLRYDAPDGMDVDYTDEEVDVRYYISLRYQSNDNDFYSHPEYYPNHVRWGLLTPTINNITNFRPVLPLGTQWDMAEKRFCNADTLDTTTECHDNMCLCTHMLDIKLGQVVELFMASHAGDPHQMHLHGYTFRVVGEGYFSDVNNFETVSLETIKTLDEYGEYPRTLINPWVKDTVTVQSKGGYVIIRFKADNPGIWFFHCHNEGHLMQGMAMVMKVGEPEEFPEPPHYHQMCGVTHGDSPGYCGPTSAASTVLSNGVILLSLTIVQSLWLLLC